MYYKNKKKKKSIIIQSINIYNIIYNNSLNKLIYNKSKINFRNYFIDIFILIYFIFIYNLSFLLFYIISNLINKCLFYFKNKNYKY